MKVTIKMTGRDYVNLMYIMTYRKPVIIIATGIGALMIAVCIVYIAGLRLINGYQPPYPQLFIGAMALVFIPLSLYFSAKRNYKANLRIQEPIEYDFTNDKLFLAGSSFKAEREWAKTYKILELKNYFLIYENNLIFNPIPKTTMTPAEISGIREVLRNVTIAGEKKLLNN